MNESVRNQIRERCAFQAEHHAFATLAATDVIALLDAVEAAERERDEALVEAQKWWKPDALARAEARSAKLEEALAMLWAYYLLPISNEQVAQVKAALAPAPPTDGSET